MPLCQIGSRFFTTSRAVSPGRGLAEYYTLRPRFSYAQSRRLNRIFANVMRPHSRFRRLVSVLLAMLVLITSVGLTVQRLTCRMSGRSTLSVSVAGHAELHACTGELTPSTASFKDSCCDFSKQVHKLSVPAHELAAQILVPAPLLAVVPSALSWPVPAPATLPVSHAPRWFAADSSPPPLGGRTLLARVCTLVV